MPYFKNIIALILAICFVFTLHSISFAGQASLIQKTIKQGDDVIISFRYQKDTDMHVVIGKCGINEMVNFKAIYLEKNTSDDVNAVIGKNAQLFMQACTDWLGPYVVKALENGDGGGSAFTGGWHSIKRDEKYYKTGMTYSFDVMSNNRTIKENKVANGAVDIQIINLIKGYNTVKSERYLLREEIRIKADNGQFDIKVRTTALEPIYITKYYGLQTQNGTWNGGVQYGNDGINLINKCSESGAKKDVGAINNFSLWSEDKKHRLYCSINDKVGIGSFKNIPDNMSTIFTEAYGKTYFNLINGNGVHLLSEESVTWEGRYVFVSTYHNVLLSVADRIKTLVLKYLFPIS